VASSAANFAPRAFNTFHILCAFTAAPGTALIVTGEQEPNPGGYVRLNGIKPLVDVTAGAMSVQLQWRDNLADAVTTSSIVAPHSRTGFANFRIEARYVRAAVTIAGTFNAAQGVEVDATPSGFT
jgi:hypothetical protein